MMKPKIKVMISAARLTIGNNVLSTIPAEQCVYRSTEHSCMKTIREHVVKKGDFIISDHKTLQIFQQF